MAGHGAGSRRARPAGALWGHLNHCDCEQAGEPGSAVRLRQQDLHRGDVVTL